MEKIAILSSKTDRFALVDDGTFDWVIFDRDRGRTTRFDDEYRALFPDNEAFLEGAIECILDDEAIELS